MKRLIVFTTVLLTLCACSPFGAQIVTTEESIADGEWMCFRGNCTLLSTAGTELRIAADTKYWLWINGQLVVREGGLKRGPTPTDSYCDVLHNVEALRFGHNTFALLVQYYGKNSFSHRASPTPGIWLELRNSLGQRIVSSKSWRAIRYDAMFVPGDENPVGQRQHRLAGANVGVDARKTIDFWAEDFDDSLWASAVEVAREQSGWGSFVDRPIPMWRWSELSDYTSISKKGDLLICRLPYNMHVCPYIRLRAKAGQHIDIFTDDYVIGKARQFHAEYITRDGEQAFEVPIWINGHDVRFRLDKGIEVLDVKWRESGFDTDVCGSFRCDDEFFNTLWQKAARTLYITMRDNYMDCPDRERAQWWGDVVVELGEAGYVFDDRAHSLTRKAIHELMNWQRDSGEIFSPIPGWYDQELPCQMLASVGYYGFWNYYMLTGDQATIEQIYDRVHRYVYDVWQTDGKSQVRMRRGGWHWGDWGKNVDKEALQNCWYAIALKGMERMSMLTNRPTEAMKARERQSIMAAMFNERFWQGDHYGTKSYKDEPDDRVQAMAVLAGFVPEERHEIMRQFFRRHYNASPYMEKYVIEALCRMGYYNDALARLKHRFHDMVVSEDYTTLWEGWQYTGGEGMEYVSGNGTYNHAWSGGGLTILSQFIAGIEPIEPQFKRFTVCPNLGTLTWVEASVPTIFGNIAIRAKRCGEQLSVELNVPTGTTAVVRATQGYERVECGEQCGPEIVLDEGEYNITMY